MRSKFISFLTSRRFAIFLLAASAGILIVRNIFPQFHSPAFLALPASLFLSISFCAAKRIKSAILDNAVDPAFCGSIVFHAGMLIVIAATSLGIILRFNAMAVLPRGMTVNMLNEDFVRINETPFRGEIPSISMRLDWQESRYKDGWLPIDHSAGLEIVYMEENNIRTANEIIRINSPVKKSGYDFILAGGSLSPLFVLKDKDKSILFSQFMKVSNETGSEDEFEIPEKGLTVYTRFFPDVFKEGGEYGTRSLEPKNPAFGIRVASKSEPFKDAWKGVLKPGEKAEFSGMTLEFADLKSVVIVQIIKDPTYRGIMAGWLLIVAGLVIRYVPLLMGKKESK